MVKEHRGPDSLLPADSLVSWQRDKPVKLRIGKQGLASAHPISVPSLFHDIVRKIPKKPALVVKRDGEWVTWTYEQYLHDVMTTAKAFIRLGLTPLHSVGILGFNSPEWFFSCLGAIYAGGFCAGIYTTNSPEAVQHVAFDSEANFLVVENDVQLQKVLKIRDNLPHLIAIIQYSGQLSENYPSVYTWKEFLEKADEVMDEELDSRLRQQAPNRCCSLIYTSGTTGASKGVMLSHDNITWTAKALIQTMGTDFGKTTLVSYLPLSHIAGQLTDIFAGFLCGGTVYFAQPDALKGSLLVTLKEVRPTMFIGVPRVWEKFSEGIKAAGRDTKGFKKKVGAWARGLALEKHRAASNGRTIRPVGWRIADRLVFQKVKAALGLDQCVNFVSSAAPLSMEMLEFFASFDMPIMEVYGMSESTGPQTTNLPWSFAMSTVGKTMSGTLTKINQPDPEGHGEICMTGRNVFMGYLNMEDKTHETLSEGGLLHSGDLGTVDKRGFLKITGRLKELLITAGGENVAPVPIEDRVKEELPCISNCMLIGDKRKFLSILLTFRTEVDPDTMSPRDELTQLTKDWCKTQGSDASTLKQLLDSRDPQIFKAIQAGIDRANARSISRAQKIQKWEILSHDFSIPGGELGPTLKLKRPVVLKMYGDTIEKIYAD